MTEMKPTVGGAPQFNLLPHWLRPRSLFKTAGPPMPPTDTFATNAGLDPRLNSVLGIFRRNSSKVVTATLAGLAISGAYLAAAEPVYTSTAELFFDPGRNKAIAEDAGGAAATPDFTYIESQVSVIRSTVVLKRVVNALHLADDPDYSRKGETGAMSWLKTLVLNESEPADAAHAALASLAKTLTVTRKLKTYIVKIDATATSPSKAVTILDAVLDAYLTEQKAALTDGGAQADTGAEARLAALRDELRLAEAATTKTVEPIMPAISPDTAEKAHTEAAEKKARYDQIVKALKVPLGKAAFPDSVYSPVLQKLRDRFADASRRVTTLSSKLGERHPDLIDAKALVAEIRTEADAELKRMAATARSDYEAAAAREQNLNAKSDKPETAAAPVSAATSSSGAQDIAKLRDRIAAEMALTGTAAAASAPLQARIINPPLEPTQPASPQKKLVLGAGLLSGLALGLAWALMSSFGDRRIHTPTDFARHLALAKIVQIPSLQDPAAFRIPWPYRIAPEPSPATQFSDMMLALSDTHGQEKAEYRQSILRLLTKLKSLQRPGRPHTVMLVAPRSGSGNSATALAIAYSAALAGERALLIDATSVKPELSTIFSTTLKPTRSITLDNKDDLQDITTRDERSGLAFLPIALADLRTLKTQQRRRLVAGITGLSQNFDLVVVDAGAILEDEAATCLIPVADQIVVVTKAGRTSHADVATTLQLLDPVAAQVTTGILTMVSNLNA